MASVPAIKNRRPENLTLVNCEKEPLKRKRVPPPTRTKTTNTPSIPPQLSARAGADHAATTATNRDAILQNAHPPQGPESSPKSTVPKNICLKIRLKPNVSDNPLITVAAGWEEYAAYRFLTVPISPKIHPEEVRLVRPWSGLFIQNHTKSGIDQVYLSLPHESIYVPPSCFLPF